MKLRGLLKGLCIFGLTLLPISFSSAGDTGPTCYEYEGLSTNVVYGNTILTFNNGNFATQRGGESLQNVMWLTRNNFSSDSNMPGYWLSSAFGYIDGKPYLFAGGYSNNVYQGYATKVCVESLDTFDLNTFGSNNICNSEDIDLYLTNKNIVGGGYCYPKSDNDHLNATFTYCFYDSLNAYCFKVRSYGGQNSNDNIIPLNNSIGLTAPLTPSKLQNVDWSPSPFNSSSSNSESPVSDIVFYSDNNQVYYDFLTLLGYNTGLCYSDFKLTDLTIIDGSRYQFFPSEVNTGVDIFTLKANWYSNFDNYSWYGQIRGLYNISSNSDDYTPYMGKTRGYYRLAYKVENNSYFSAYQPNGTDLFIYCDMALNGFDSNGLFTGNLSPSATNIFINSDYRNNYTEDKNGEFVLSGSNEYFSGDEVGFFDLFNHLYTRFKHGFSVNPSNTGFTGILPTFVVFGFLLMLLLYGFKR